MFSRFIVNLIKWGALRYRRKRMAHIAKQTPEAFRRGFRRVTSPAPLSWRVRCTPFMIGNIQAERIVPKRYTPNRVIMHCHGGGYVIGDRDTHRAFAAQLALYMQAEVVIFEYRLAPEHPYPAGLEDSVTVYKHLQSELNGRMLIISGDSAGGGMALATMLRLRDTGITLPSVAVLQSPWTDLTISGESAISKIPHDPIIEVSQLPRWAAWYAGNTPTSNPEISPLLANHQGLPPTLIQVGGDELLLSDSTRLHEKLKAAGVKAELDVYEGMIHVWHFFFTILPTARKALREMNDFITTHEKTN